MSVFGDRGAGFATVNGRAASGKTPDGRKPREREITMSASGDYDPCGYQQDMDLLFSKGRTWEHRTLKTLFASTSYEWSLTSMSEKIEILRRIAEDRGRMGVSGIVEAYIKCGGGDEPAARAEIMRSLLEIVTAMLVEPVRA
jgi:hypothetical protein